MNERIPKFVQQCKERYRYTKEDLQILFSQLLWNPFFKEKNLQAYLFFNINDLFPECDELLLFESPIYKNESQNGVIDFLFLTKDEHLYLIETKYIPPPSGANTKKKRRRHKVKVHEQVLRFKNQFLKYYDLKDEDFYLGIFTTEATHRNPDYVKERNISEEQLLRWKGTCLQYNGAISQYFWTIELSCELSEKIELK